MVLYLVGLGLGDEKDITVRGLETVRKCSKLFLEHYTSILGVDVQRLEAFYGKSIVLADRFMVESSAEEIYTSAVDTDVALLVVGDPLCATTHTDMMIRAREAGARVEVIHNASVMGAVASCGLQLYQFGQTVSVPFFDGEWRPDSFYDKIACNDAGKMHTLVLLDIKVKEPDFGAMVQGRTAFLPPRFMTVNQCVAQLIEVEARRGDAGTCAPDRMAIGLARLGQPTQQIVAGTLEELLCVDFGGPLHSLVLCGDLHDIETAFLEPLRAPSVSKDEAQKARLRASAEVDDLVTDGRCRPGVGNQGHLTADRDPISDDGLSAEENQISPPAPPAPSPPEKKSGVTGKSGVTRSLPDEGARECEIDEDELFEFCGLNRSDMKDGVAVISDDEEGF